MKTESAEKAPTARSTTSRLELYKVVLLALCVLGVATATYAVGSLRLVGASPGDGAWSNKRSVKVTAHYSGLVGNAVIALDGHALPTQVDKEREEIVAVAEGMADGPHTIALHARRALGMGEVDRDWTINVDTSPEKIALDSPPPGAVVKDKLLKVEGRTKPGSRLSVRVKGKQYDSELSPFTVESNGTFSALVQLVDDKNKIQIEALDRAGNSGHLTLGVLCDLDPPVIDGIAPEPDSVIKDAPQATITAQVVEKGSGIKRATLTVDGRDHDLTLDPTGGDISFKVSDLPEGTCEVALEVEDKAGWKARKEWKFLVDTSETFGERPMTLGARGKDVTVLQKRLVRCGVLSKDHVTSLFDEATRQAVQDFQAAHNMDVDGAVGFKTIGALSPKIVINLSTFTLVLMDSGKKVKSYRIAHGMPEYPTPTGNYRVTYLEKNPTWIPPKDSVWAKEAKITPPGPGNPLGTRWIGLDSNAVGIHGTPMAWTVGSRASHGCIRMRIPDVEDLFTRINPGTQVIIAWGRNEVAKSR